MDAVTEKTLGTIQQVSGTLKVIKADGREKELLIGDVINHGDVLIAEGGPVLLSLSNGRVAEVTSGQSLDLGSALILEGLGLISWGAANVAVVEELENLQAPAAGTVLPDEPTGAGLPTAPPAAGGPQNSGIGQSSSTAFGSDEVVVQFGFDTNALAFNAAQPRENIIEPLPALDSSPESTLETGVINLADQVRSEDSSGQSSSISFTITSTDGVSDVAFSALGLNQLNSAGYTSEGEPIVFSLSADGSSISGVSGGVTVLEISFDTSADLTSGTITATIFGQLDHDGDNSDALALSGLALQVTDGDLNNPDVVTEPFSIVVADSLPFLGTADSVSLIEKSSQEADTNSLISQSVSNIFEPSSVSGSLAIDWGADNANIDGGAFDRSVVFDPVLDGQIAPFTSDGQQVTYSLQQGGTVLVASVPFENDTLSNGPSGEEQIILQISLDDLQAGNYLFELLGPVDHSEPVDSTGGSNDSLELSFAFIATDADGDVVSGEFSTTVNDDAPSVGENSFVRLDDDELSDGIAGGIDDDAAAPQNVAGTLNHNFGADGSGSIAWVLPQSSNGFTYELSGNVLGVSQNGVLVLTATITNTATGAYSIEQVAPIDHGDVQNENDLQLTLSYIATDGDGDQSTQGALTINLDDDTPVSRESIQDEIPQGNRAFNGSISFASNTHIDSTSLSFDVNGYTLTATATGYDGTAAEIHQGGRGAGVSSDGESHNGRFREINYNIADDGDHQAESLNIVLDDNTFATRVSLEMTAFFSNSSEAENGTVLFYYDGQLVGTEGFSSLDASGQFNGIITLQNKTIFDEIRIQAADDDKQGTGDNSDFYVKTVTFSSEDVASITTGTLGGEFGADGPGSFTFSDNQAAQIFLSDGITAVALNTSPDGSRITGVYQDGDEIKQAFILEITNPVAGRYELIQLAELYHTNDVLPFSYVITDGDGDTHDGEFEISIPDTVPTGSNVQLSLDENGLVDDIAGNETVSTVLQFSSTDALSGFSFGDTDDISVTGLDGTLSWSINDNGELIGSLNDTGTIKLLLNGDLTAQTVQVTAELLEPLPHVDNTSQTDDAVRELLTINGIKIVATDADNSEGTGMVSVTVVDDVPFLELDGPAEVNEGSSIQGNLGLFSGADAPASMAVKINGQLVTANPGTSNEYTVTHSQGATLGTLTLNPAGPMVFGDWLFEANDGLDNDVSSFTFSVSVEDADGDIRTEEHTVTVRDASVPVISVDEAALSVSDNTSSDSDGNNFTITSSDELASVVFTAAPTAITGLDDAASVQWSGLNTGTLTATFNNGATLVLTLVPGTTIVNTTGNTTAYSVQATLNGALSHEDQVNVNSLLASGVQVTVTDVDNSTDTMMVSVDVSDALPSIGQDQNTDVNEGASVNGTLGLNYGADGAGTVTVTSANNTLTANGNGGYTVTQGTIAVGTLVVDSTADTWSFTANNGLDNDVLQAVDFTVTITDADGDSTHADYSVTIGDNNVPVLSVDEAALSVSDNTSSDSDGNNFTITSSDELASVVFTAAPTAITGLDDAASVQWSGLNTGTLTATFNNGATLVLTLVPGTTIVNTTGNTTAYSVQATLNGALSHADQVNVNSLLASGVQVTVTDVDNSTDTMMVSVDVSDALPSIGQDQNTDVNEGASVNGTLGLNYGADGAGTITVTSANNTLTANGNGGYTVTQGNMAVGTLVVDSTADTWSFTANNGLDNDALQAVDFTVTITDADGDSTHADYSVTIGDNNVPVLSVDEAALSVSDNTSSDSDGNNFTITSSDELASVVFTAAPTAITGLDDAASVQWSGLNTGTLTATFNNGATLVLTLIPGTTIVNTTGNTTAYSVQATLNGALSHEDQVNVNSLLASGVQVTVTDVDNSTDTMTVSVDVSDALPSIGQDQNTDVNEGASVNGTLGLNYGADGAGTVTVTSANNTFTANGNGGYTVTQGTIAVGTLVVDSTADTWSFTANNGLDNDVLQAVDFTVTITDADGDSTHADYSVTIGDNNVPVLSVDEAALSVSDNTSSDSDGNNFTITSSDELASVVFTAAPTAMTGLDDAASVQWSGLNTGTLTATFNNGATLVLTLIPGTTIVNTTVNTTAYSVQATLNGALSHEDQVNVNSLLASGVQVTATDVDNSTDTMTVSVDVSDAVPSCSPTQNDVDVITLDGLNATIDLTSSNVSNGQFVQTHGTIISVRDYDGGTAASLNITSGGSGVKSANGDTGGGNPGRFNELNFRIDSDGSSHSEAIVIDLNGQVANEMILNLSAFYTNEGEKGKVIFYRNGQEVNSQEFTLTNVAFNTGSAGGLFDRVEIQAANNGNATGQDNSDFNVKSVTFTANVAIASASGQLEADFGADGPGSILFNSLQSDVVTLVDGTAVSLQVSNSGGQLVGIYDDNGTEKQAFVLTVNADGTYEFVQYETLANDVNGLQFDYVISDSDGDSHDCVLTIVPDSKVDISIQTVDALTSEDSSEGYAVFEVETSAQLSAPASVDVTVYSGTTSEPALLTDLNLSGLEVSLDGGSSWNSLSNGGAVNMSPGQSGFLIRVSAEDDSLFESVEDFSVAISNPSGGVNLGGTTSVTADILSDDQAKDLSVSTADNTTPTFNLLLSLDVSGSMTWNSVEQPQKTTLQVAREALVELITEYGDQGNVNVILTQFYTSAVNPQFFDNAADAIDYINTASNFSAGGGTNYDAGLDSASSAFKNALYEGKIDGSANNVVYFISDGDPRDGDPNRAEWEGFLQDYNVERSYAIGVQGYQGDGETLNTYSGERLDDIAYPGASIKLDGSDSLSDTLLDTVPQVITENLITHSLGNASTATVSSVRVNDTTYSLSNTGASQQQSIQVVSSGSGVVIGLLIVKYTGEISFQPADIDSGGTLSEVVTYQLADSEGNLSNVASLAIEVTDTGNAAGFTFPANSSPNIINDSEGNQVGTDADDRFVDWYIPDDFDAGEGNDLVIDNSNAANDIRGQVGDDLIDGRRHDDVIRGDGGRDMLYGGDGNDSLYGGGEDDFLVGGRGNDIINGNDGNDILVGGIGDDTMRGHNGQDTFRFSLADLVDNDLLVGSSYTQNDSILDFERADNNQPGDILDLRDLLVSDGPLSSQDIETLLSVSFDNSNGSDNTTISYTHTVDNPQSVSSNFTLNINLENVSQSDWDNPNDVLSQLVNNGQLLV